MGSTPYFCQASELKIMPIKTFLVDDCTKLENTGVTLDGLIVWRKWCQTTERSGWTPSRSERVKSNATRRQVCEAFNIVTTFP
jgi:hypothetical protein